VEVIAGVSNIIIRPACLDDMKPAVQLMQLSKGHLADFLYGLGPRSVEVCLCHLFERNAGRLGYGVCSIAERDGQAAGVLLSFPGVIYPRLELAAGWELIRFYGLRGTPRFLRNMLYLGFEPEAEKDEYYLSNMAVLPEFQGQGIGSRLLEYAEQAARSNGLKKCSLLVAMKNVHARRLYERFGYRVVYSHQYKDGSHGLDYHRMVKALV